MKFRLTRILSKHHNRKNKWSCRIVDRIFFFDVRKENPKRLCESISDSDIDKMSCCDPPTVTAIWWSVVELKIKNYYNIYNFIFFFYNNIYYDFFLLFRHYETEKPPFFLFSFQIFPLFFSSFHFCVLVSFFLVDLCPFFNLISFFVSHLRSISQKIRELLIEIDFVFVFFNNFSLPIRAREKNKTPFAFFSGQIYFTTPP